MINLLNYFKENLKTIDCTFSTEQSLEEALENIKKESEIAVRQGFAQIVLTDKNVSENKYPIPILLSVGAINTYLIKLKIERICIY